MQVAFQPVTQDNLQDVWRLKVAPAQDEFVAPNVYSVAEAYAEPALTPLAIYGGEDLVGFAMFGRDDETGRWWIIRFMIGEAHQGKGYGGAALRALLELMGERHGCREVFLSYVPGNDVAERLYARVGFVPTGEVEEGEVVSRVALAPVGEGA